MHILWLAVVIYLLILVVIVGAAIYGIAYIARKGWNKAGGPPN